MSLNDMYATLGVSPAVYEYGERVLAGLKARFEAVDAVAEYNQAKVLSAMQKHRVSAACFAATTGYGYDDMGRETLEKVYADVFHTEAALVRPQITCGTHALATALSANLRPGDELLSPVGAPYDTLEEVIGIRPSPCSLKEYGVSYRQAAASTTTPSAPPSTTRPGWSPSSAPRATPPGPPSPSSRSGS